MKNFLAFCFVTLLMVGNSGFAQQNNPFLEKEFSEKISKEIHIRYLIHLPDGYDSLKRSLPLLLYLHGGLGRGNDFKKLYWYPVPKMILENKFPDSFIVLIPQCPEGKYWPELTDELLTIINEVIEKYSIDTTRIYGMGYSMGGNGMAYFAYMNPDKFSAIALMSGKYNTWWISRLKKVPAWFFHGVKDTHVNVSEADNMVDEYIKADDEVIYTRNPDGEHRPPTEEQHLDVLRWFLEHSK